MQYTLHKYTWIKQNYMRFFELPSRRMNAYKGIGVVIDRVGDTCGLAKG